MPSRSLCVHPDWIEQVNQAYKTAYEISRCPNQKDFADRIDVSPTQVGLSIDTLNKFLAGCEAGKVDRAYFYALCKRLKLDAEQIQEGYANAEYEEVLASEGVKQTPWHQAPIQTQNDTLEPSQLSSNNPFPEGPLSTTSPFYIQRPNIEDFCVEAIGYDGCLLRIKSPRLMGKTSLLFYLQAVARNQGYRTAFLDLKRQDDSRLKNLDIFLRCFCTNISNELNLKNQINEEWDISLLGSNDNCTAYFRKHFLCDSTPLLLLIDGIDTLFFHDKWARFFFGLLRFWHETSREDNGALWRKLRIILSYSTEAYIPLDSKESPFNVGIPVELYEFESSQITQLLEAYKFTLGEDTIPMIMKIVGGHPHLIRFACYYCKRESISLKYFFWRPIKINFDL